MNYEWLAGFSPKLLDVVDRQTDYWRHFNYRLYREQTRLHVFAYVYAGIGSLKIGDKSKELRPGVIFQVWPGERMQIDTQPAKPVCFYSVQYQYGILHWSGTQAEWVKAEGPLPIGDTLIEAGGVETASVFERMHRIWNGKDAGYEWESRVAFLETVRLAASVGARARERNEAGSASAVRGAIAYMKSHYSEALDRDKLAREVALSPAYFSSLFKRHTGYSPIQYLNRLRLDRAKLLLRQTDWPIRQVAEAVGYADAFYFTRLFTKETGLSPRQYRNA